MGEVIELKTKKAFEDNYNWRTLYYRVRAKQESDEEQVHMWYNKYIKLNRKVYNMSLWDRIFNWPY